MMCLLRLFSASLGVLMSVLSWGQYWAPADLPVVVDGQLSQFYADEEEGLFCICGRTEMPEGSQSEWRNGLVCNINGVWDTLGVFDSEVTSVAKWGDTLFVAGGFTGVDQQPFSGNLLTRYDGAWHQDPQLTQLSHGGHLRKVGDSIYLLGHFEASPGVSLIGVGLRQGGRWLPVGNLPPPDSPNGAHWLFDIIEYNGQLVVTGSINATTGYDVFILEDEDWVPLGGGLVGWNSFGNCLAVYQGDLYVGGGMSMAAGDVGQNIIRWDGNQWHPLGSGLQSALNNFGTTGTVRDMVVHNDELFVCGGFRYAGGIPVTCVARWNGSEWCSLSDDFQGSYAYCMGFFQDTLYVNASGDQNWQQEFGYVAKFIAPEYENVCGLWTDVEEQPAPEPALRAWLQDGMVALDGLPLGMHQIRIVDATGRLVQQEQLLGMGGKDYIRLTALSTGIYLISVPQLGMITRLHILH